MWGWSRGLTHTNRGTGLAEIRFPNSIKGDEAIEEKEKGSEAEWQVEDGVQRAMR